MLQDIEDFNASSDVKLFMRIGINSGSLIAGVIGKTKFIHDIWGDTVNVASRMESSGETSKIHVSVLPALTVTARVGNARGRALSSHNLLAKNSPYVLFPIADILWVE